MDGMECETAVYNVYVYVMVMVTVVVVMDKKNSMKSNKKRAHKCRSDIYKINANLLLPHTYVLYCDKRLFINL